MAKMKELAYRRPVWKEITHIMGTDNKVCVEYTGERLLRELVLSSPGCL